jgi:hypothetical protein
LGKLFAGNSRRGTLPCMSEELRLLVERAKLLKPSKQDAEEQRRSFAYGNLRLEDDRVTRAQIDQAAEALEQQSR